MAPFGSSNWLYIILIGLVVGILARLVTPGRRRMGVILTCLLGIGGALLGTWGGQQMGWYALGQTAGFFGALLGAIVILGLLQLLRPR
ncbi:GlsB/YeaQ/YmgE family stress response membrane protein [Luteimonas yindakuii]|uniref:GlsB/YeaQ/YmgE family stress response membrane protein n=1 Tax=Luteimonas yindakuii TaxID=2565782 RepID=UPI0010A56208|nr:GlsB/YeaQ/YmgE family stress response membrane protein [Luteimonas yindakuii]QCO67257.1 GlsB/YeaQ/YmgE family stress response membrane protein [Luteimonas yindakuii]